ncbi:MAG: DEAD/DEAH box helicase family protein [Deltaproteobacteria bacterium]|nr:DEAD/DEAH box helicase family protein [Deltaproteobacteria bacterium]
MAHGLHGTSLYRIKPSIMETDIEEKLRAALAECERLRADNRLLRQKLGTESQEPLKTVAVPTETSNLSADQKITLFRSLFRGREDVYALRWEGKDGKKGYSPACSHDWDCPLCSHDRSKRSRCENRKFLPLTDQAIRDHLSGKQTIGLYPLLVDETCWFLAADFDKENWLEDAKAFLRVCQKQEVDGILERSRSGKGGHVWIFFETPIAASLARRLGSFLLTKAMEKRHQIGLNSYDRLFPNQDTMPKGGFGNLIALPLQREPRSCGNSAFIDENGNLHEDQWSVLSQVHKLAQGKIQKILAAVDFHSDVGDIPMVSDDEEQEGVKPWDTPKEKTRKRKIKGPFPEKVNVVSANMIFVEKHGLPSAMLNRILRLAAFQNPEFYRAQAMRLSTFGKPRIIYCGEDFSDHVAVPRGCLNEVVELMREHGMTPQIRSECFSGRPIKVSFKGELRELQKEAAKELAKHNIGVLSATTAFGKTVVAAWMIVSRKTNTLILVHRKQLMDQWRERLSMFLGLPPKSIGVIGGGRSKATGIVDIATIQTLHREGEVKPVVADYGHLIVDECHHVSAFSVEQVLKNAKAKYVLGLTATPIRKDGHHPIITMQCGPIRYKVTAKQQRELTAFEHVVTPRYTPFQLPTTDQQLSIQEIYSALIQNEQRNDLIFDDLMKALEAGRSPLILTERTEHLEEIERRLKGFVKNVFVLRGGMGRKQRELLMTEMAKLPDTEERVILSTGRYIGEGFDDSRLDTLFLVIPISWKGTLQQYVGRLHRSHEGKNVVQVYDYVDQDVPMLRRMFLRRVRGYRAIGYSLQEDQPTQKEEEPVRYVVGDEAAY